MEPEIRERGEGLLGPSQGKKAGRAKDREEPHPRLQDRWGGGSLPGQVGGTPFPGQAGGALPG